jgi:hypothetical protein
VFLSGPAAISEARLGAGPARPQFETLAPQKAWQLAGLLAACRLGCCMCTCIVSLTAQVRLICSWCMKICLRRTAHISAERLISVQTDMQTDKRYGDEYGCVYRRQVCIYIRAFWPREISQSTSQRSIQSNIGRLGTLTSYAMIIGHRDNVKNTTDAAQTNSLSMSLIVLQICN